MDDLKTLRDAWEQPAPPAPDAHQAARAALMRQITDRGAQPRAQLTRGRRPARRLAIAAAVAAAATGLALVAGTVALTAGSTESPPATAAGTSPGQEVLLAAANTALAQPNHAGDYWYVKQEINDPVFELEGGQNPQRLETWTGHVGGTWSRNLCCDEVYQVIYPAGFLVGGSLLTYPQLQDLPTDPGQLVAWMTDLLSNPIGWSAAPDAPTVEAADPPAQGRVAFSLSELLYRAPVSPEVRAAAFRALAAMPEVTSLGAMDGGEALEIVVEPPAADKYPDGELPADADRIRLVIDPATSTLLSMTYNGATTTILAAHWTDQAPPTVP